MDNDTLDTIGKAIGFALAVYDQTAPGDAMTRINETRRTLDALIDDESFSPEVASVVEGVSAGLVSYMRVNWAEKSDLPASGDYLL
ncbi:hypothetical protein [Comamonas sp. 17RB]|uniref:hypothetical protein n=1 Tax=Comamonas sp. 17RB TaxID=3047025 RepID=UPI0024B752F8|nr:hypothetical protein [Comamonas sp. 17RB]MDI9855219.1 hypothetical protein [Comamonas sp. 17RB]